MGASTATTLPALMRAAVCHGVGVCGTGGRHVAPDLLSLDHLVGEGPEPMARGESSRIKTLVDPWASQSGPVP